MHSLILQIIMNFSDAVFQREPSRFQNSSRRATNYKDGKTSAESQLAHWNEDWTVIADMTERRRIQNRIAQRNYRQYPLPNGLLLTTHCPNIYSHIPGRRLKERLSRLEEHATRSGKPSKHEDGVKDEKHRSDFSHSSQSQSTHKDTLPSRMVNARDSTTDSTPPNCFQQDHIMPVDQRPVTTSPTFSSNCSSLGSQPSMNTYTDFSTMFEDVVFDIPDSQVWRRDTWPQQ